MNDTYDALALFSGGLDSILAVRLVKDQGLRVLGLHFVSPFFGHTEKTEQWQKDYCLPIRVVPVDQEFVDLLVNGPQHGFGRTLNPCIDCKVLLLNIAKGMMKEYGASFLISGEVIGQRPMSQRRDSLNAITRDSETRNILLRPLCAKLLPPTLAEEQGLIDRSRLEAIWGRGRKEQLRLAEAMGISPIPTPAGGCLLTEPAASARFWPIFARKAKSGPEDFHLSNCGRQFWKGERWLTIGRNKADNECMTDLVRPDDYVLALAHHPGPLAVGRPMTGEVWTEEDLAEAASIMAGYSPKARKSRRAVEVLVDRDGQSRSLTIMPAATGIPGWAPPLWNEEALTVKAALGGESQPTKDHDDDIDNRAS
ncbi:MAG: DUF814 domain-containing protein [Deltaproteobacteria bacterium]|nr:DUF814 domain-containing protein [Deltaproteobacteria bacterium]